jgi:hypothetical protein
MITACSFGPKATFPVTAIEQIYSMEKIWTNDAVADGERGTGLELSKPASQMDQNRRSMEILKDVVIVFLIGVAIPEIFFLCVVVVMLWFGMIELIRDLFNLDHHD